MSPLSEKSFIAVWLLSSLLTTFLGSRYKYAALAFAGVTGGVVFSLAISVIIHPSLLTRIVLTSIIAPILTLLVCLPLERFQHPSLRLAACSIGSFGLVLSIALLAHIPAWANVWSRYWLKSSLEWGGSKERGLDAGFCLFLLVGIASDYLLRRLFGECPDEKWDTYLANYTSNLPNRAGTFKPFESFWDRWFASKSSRNTTGDEEMIFPEDPKHPVNHLSPLHRNASSSPFLPGRHSSRNTLRSPKLARFESGIGSGAFSATTTVVEDDADYELYGKAKAKEADLTTGFILSGDEAYDLPGKKTQGFLKKARSNQTKSKRFTAKNLGKDAGEGVKKKRDPVKFRPEDGFLSSDDEDGSSEDEQKMKGLQGTKRPPYLKQSTSMASTNTAISFGAAQQQQQRMKGKNDGVDLDNLEIDYEKEIERLKVFKRRTTQGLGDGEVPDYSDYESDLGSPTTLTPSIEKKEKEGGLEWTPGFMRRASSQHSGSQGAKSSSTNSNASTSTLVPPGSPVTTTASSGPKAGIVQPTPTSPNAATPPAFLTGLGAVPATPSLIRALDRVALAQKDAYTGAATAGAGNGVGLPRVEEEREVEGRDRLGEKVKDEDKDKGKRWESFWRDVRDKAQS
ncbi:hypothetical protein K435DRAFT_782714 [Dendrothele bispora CBS 962.96]|uniref:DUF4203 domain-containing protein n=1 Tax=Dendrothele bispora (strain CBS 962.96) TaxID=1314807 RepID=A0A4S8LDC4_DENBC|nr:hypothetical protein K435DRAFT_782714 [Dendrothele bispora CBS 962.96]